MRNTKFFSLSRYFLFYQYDKFSSSEKVIDYLKDLVNFADGWYQEFGVRLILVHVEIWKNGDPFETVFDANEVRSKICRNKAVV